MAQLKFDPLSKEFSENPYKIYQALRSVDAPYYFADQDMYLLSRYDDVSQIATNRNMVRSLDGLISQEETQERQRRANWHDMPYHERVVQFSLLDSDGEVHRRLRKQVFGTFTARSIAALEPVVQAFVDRLIKGFKDNDQIDFIEDFAAHVPGYVIGHLLGAPEVYSNQLRLWSEQVVQYFDVDRSGDKKQKIGRAS